MDSELEFPDLLRLIDERSAAFRVAVASAPSLEVPVPTCTEWTLSDLVQHLGQGRRRWAAVVAAGPSTVDPATRATQRIGTSEETASVKAAPRDREALDTWLAESTQELLDALREAGPDRSCWTWWGTSQSPQTCGAVARHQLQEVAVHTYDAQLAVGTAQPLPDDVALDGVEEFLSTCVATTAAWPHDPAVVDYHATEGRSWRLWLSADGARAARLPAPTSTGSTAAGEDHAPVRYAPYASARGTAAELVMAFYGRTPVEALALDGDGRVFDQLIAWEPEA
ncbi:TIGR03083 family protein [Pedococcus cremeus]|uniref:TIGR03083 family protein n=1 Tax=Pedococcus cremeus TaxID=587636 RepID=A0A1H9WR50_9MICO|nr:maleylpyruvate isomerase N-terminal domain-containing protein [Pedococcus cremeus]SES36147.1 TIGR03083 family protein [Pedococcus cremeus]